MKKYLLFLPLALLISCKTAKEIEREQNVENITLQVTQGQKMSAAFSSRLDQLEERMSVLQGNIEGQSFSANEAVKQELDGVKQELAVTKEQLSGINAKLEEQEKFLKEVLDTLSSLTGANKSLKKNPKKPQSSYQEGLKHYREGKFLKAQELFQEALGQVQGKELAHTLHNLGMIEFNSKRYDQAVAYFGRLFTGHPNATYTPGGLLYMSRSLRKLNKNKEAKGALEQLIKQYPNSKQVAEAKKELASMSI